MLFIIDFDHFNFTAGAYNHVHDYRLETIRNENFSKLFPLWIFSLLSPKCLGQRWGISRGIGGT
jgi:hypothetical protein